MITILKWASVILFLGFAWDLGDRAATRLAHFDWSFGWNDAAAVETAEAAEGDPFNNMTAPSEPAARVAPQRAATAIRPAITGRKIFSTRRICEIWYEEMYPGDGTGRNAETLLVYQMMYLDAVKTFPDFSCFEWDASWRDGPLKAPASN